MYKPDEYGNRSVVMGFAVLKALMSIGHPASPGEIGRVLGMTASRTHRFLAGLEKIGAVSHDAEAGKYNLGPLLIELGARALGQVDVIRMGMEAINALAQSTGLVSILCTWGSNGATVIKWVQGNKITALHVREGANLSLLTTAAGNVFLAFLPWETTKSFVTAEIKTAQTNGRPWTMSNVEKIRKAVREKGVAFSQGKSHPSLMNVSCPVFDSKGDLALALAIIGDSKVINVRDNSGMVAALKAAATKLSTAFGHSERDG